MKGEESSVLSRIEDLCGQAQRKHVPVHTSFLSPAEIAETAKFNAPYGLNIISWGGYKSAERRVVAVYPDFYSFDASEELNDALDIKIVKCRNTAEKSLSHRDFLGSLMSLGIERSVIGDILVCGNEAYIFVQSVMADYITSNMEKVSNCRVEYSLLDFVSEDDLQPFMPKTEERTVIVPSMRLDCFIAEAYGLSRSEATETVKNGLVRIDYVVCDRPDRKISEGDLISTTGKGRLLVSEVLGLTRKESVRVKVLIYI